MHLHYVFIFIHIHLTRIFNSEKKASDLNEQLSPILTKLHPNLYVNYKKKQEKAFLLNLLDTRQFHPPL